MRKGSGFHQVGLLVTASVVAFASLPGEGQAAQADAASAPALAVMVSAPMVNVARTADQPRVVLDLGAFVVAERSAFEIRVTRRSYHDPIVAKQVVREHGRIRLRTLGEMEDFAGFPDFFQVSLTDAAGRQVLDVNQDFCPNAVTARVRPGSPDSSPYPPSCPRHPFTLGSVWGVQAGWGTSATSPFEPVDTTNLPDGVYTARLSVARPYQDIFTVSAPTATVQVALTTVAQPTTPQAAGAGHPTASPTAAPAGVPRSSRPDLVALPAWAINVLGDRPRTPEIEPERLIFNASVWNAGPSPLVVDGVRRADTDVMDSYQVFFDDRGRPIGQTPVGSMEWDPREEHDHWHFRDVAGYRLLDADLREVVRSDKEAFCLANTDAIDLFVPGAVWQPDNTDLHSACGDQDSQTVRQVLATGHGDTYANSIPGRALTIEGLPNGTYYIEIVANPDHNLYESKLGNNTSLRQVILDGTPGDRTVSVPPYELIDTDLAN